MEFLIRAVLTTRKQNVIFLNLHGNCSCLPNPNERLETVRISSVLSFGALMISEPTNDAETESFKVMEVMILASFDGELQ